MKPACVPEAARAAFIASARALQRRKLARLLHADPERPDRLLVRHHLLTLDLSRLHVDSALLAQGVRLLDAIDAGGKRAALLTGGIANGTENRPALHTALRAAKPVAATPAGLPVAAPVLAARAQMQAITERIRADSAIRNIIHIGIGGSVLGPQLVLDALSRPGERRFTTRFLANIDGEAALRATDGLDPRETLVLVASKSWTTLETQRNAAAIEAWMLAGGAPAAHRRIAITAKPELARAAGYGDEAILPFADWVGGRYSLWSGIGLPVALALGWPAFAQLLAGAAQMDAHFAAAPWRDNLPALAALAAYAYAATGTRKTRAVFSYDERLALLVPYLSQLEMESLGKNVSTDGTRLATGAPVTWGGVGTDAQHAVFQWLHHASDDALVEFVCARTGGGDPAAHACLLANMLAQSAALANGLPARTVRQALAKQGLDAAGIAALAPHKVFPGNRPSAILMLDAVTAEGLGALLAFYEHRTVVFGWLLGLNPFDQWGVELGKTLASAIEQGLVTADATSAPDAIAARWIERLTD